MATTTTPDVVVSADDWTVLGTATDKLFARAFSGSVRLVVLAINAT